MGKIRRFFDSLFYGILSRIDKGIRKSLKNDPEIEKAKQQFDEAQKGLNKALGDFANNPQKYIDDFKEGQSEEESRDKLYDEA